MRNAAHAPQIYLWYNSRMTINRDLYLDKLISAKHDGIVKILDAKGYDSSFESRAKIAKLNGIKDYTGTAEQNEKMVKLIKAGKLIKKKVKS